MSLFMKAENSQAFLKCGILGFAGSGKTYTATNLAIGLAKYAKLTKPVFFLDTETGSDWMQPRFKEAGLELMTSKTRAFTDLVPALVEVEKQGGILIIDSITHFWREITESYAKKKNRQRGLEFQDWAWLKKTWGEFTDKFVNAQCHIIMCGRAGYEYDYFDNESGKKELQKTGIKMKAETETGYEPSLLILMERSIDPETNIVTRVGNVLKDRADKLDGKSFKDPTFENFLPHIQYLSLGAFHVGVDTTRNSEGMIDTPGRDWKWEQEQKEITLDEIQTLLVEYYPSQSTEHKTKKIQLLKECFGTASWERISKTFDLNRLKDGFNNLRSTLEPDTKVKLELEATPLEKDDVPDFGKESVN